MPMYCFQLVDGDSAGDAIRWITAIVDVTRADLVTAIVYKSFAQGGDTNLTIICGKLKTDVIGFHTHICLHDSP